MTSMRNKLDYIRTADRELWDIAPAGQGTVELAVPPYNYLFCPTEGTLDAIHNHKRRYQSTVLKGAVKNRVFGVRPGGDLNVYAIECPMFCGKGGCGGILKMEGVEATLAYEQTVNVGECYFMEPEMYHLFEVLESGTITRQVWGLTELDETFIVVPPEYEQGECEIEQYTEDELWEIVYSCL